MLDCQEKVTLLLMKMIFFLFVSDQVGHLGEEYQEWIHQPIVCVEGPRFFQSDFWEVTTLFLFNILSCNVYHHPLCFDLYPFFVKL